MNKGKETRKSKDQVVKNCSKGNVALQSINGKPINKNLVSKVKKECVKQTVKKIYKNENALVNNKSTFSKNDIKMKLLHDKTYRLLKSMDMLVPNRNVKTYDRLLK